MDRYFPNPNEPSFTHGNSILKARQLEFELSSSDDSFDEESQLPSKLMSSEVRVQLFSSKTNSEVSCDQSDKQIHSKVCQFILKKCSDLSYICFYKGSKKLQKLLKTIKNKNEISCIFQEISKLDLVTICTDQFGNYFLQTLISKLGSTELHQLSKYLKQKKYDICLDEYGNRVIQCLLFNQIKYNFNSSFLSEIVEIVEVLGFHKYGCFILQNLLELSSRNKLLEFDFLLSYIEENFYSLCCHITGVVLLKKYIIYIKNRFAKKEIDIFLNEYIQQKLPFLSQHKVAHFLIIWITEQFPAGEIPQLHNAIQYLKLTPKSMYTLAVILLSASRLMKKERRKVIKNLIKLYPQLVNKIIYKVEEIFSYEDYIYIVNYYEKSSK